MCLSWQTFTQQKPVWWVRWWARWCPSLYPRLRPRLAWRQACINDTYHFCVAAYLPFLLRPNRCAPGICLLVVGICLAFFQAFSKAIGLSDMPGICLWLKNAHFGAAAYAGHMPGRWESPSFARLLKSGINWAYTGHMPAGICRAYAWHMPIFQAYAQHMLGICPIFASLFHFRCQEYARHMPGHVTSTPICPAYARHMPHIPADFSGVGNLKLYLFLSWVP